MQNATVVSFFKKHACHKLNTVEQTAPGNWDWLFKKITFRKAHFHSSSWYGQPLKKKENLEIEMVPVVCLSSLMRALCARESEIFVWSSVSTALETVVFLSYVPENW